MIVTGARQHRGQIVALALAVVIATPVLLIGSGAAAAPPAGQRGVAAERPDDGTLQVSGGEVRAITQVGNTIVAGGTFTTVGPARRGAAGVVDTGLANFASLSFPDVVGAVYASVPDGAGGWWIGGDFTTVGGMARTNVAHVLADNSVDPAFAPVVNGVVRSISAGPSSVFFGGAFTTVNGSAANRVASVQPTGALNWGGAANATIFAVEFDPATDKLYVGGDFSTYVGSINKRFVRLNAATGAVDAAFASGTVNLTVRDIALASNEVWVGGDFNKVNTSTRNRVAAFSSLDGSLLSPAPSVNQRVNSIAIDSANSVVYVGGLFTNVSGSNRNGFAGFSRSTGALASGALAVTGEVSVVALDGVGSAYLAGSFVMTPEKSVPRTLAKVALADFSVSKVVPDLALPLSLARTPREAFGIRSLALSGSSLLVAGDFSDFGTIAQPYLVAWDATTKALVSSFTPALDGPVYALDGSADGSGVYVGGAFASAGGATAGNIAKLAIGTGAQVPGFALNVDSYVKEIVAHPDGQRVFIGGNFRFAGPINIERFAGIDSTSGAVLAGYQIDLTEPTNALTEGGVRAMSLHPDGTKLVVTGNFKLVEGLDRPLVTVLDVSNPTVAVVTDWRTLHYLQPCTSGRPGWMRDVSYSVDGTKFYVVTSGHYYYPACDSVNAFDSAAPGTTSPLWTSRPGDTIETIAATQDALYIGGHFRWLDYETATNPRFQIAAIDPETGAPLSWNPSANGFRGVLTLEAEPSGLLIGGDGTAVGGVAHGGFARFSWPSDGLRFRRSTNRMLMLSAGDTANATYEVTNPTPTDYVVSSMNDSLLGPVGGLGTCILPVTVTAGTTWSCSVAHAFPPTPMMTDTTVTTTVTGTFGANPRALTDRTMYRSVLAYRAPIIRTVNAPNTVAFPSGTTTFAMTAMNESELSPLVIDSLTSSLHGNLNGIGTCAVPQVVAPRTMYTCWYDGSVAGAIGTSVGNNITMNVTQDAVAIVKSHSTSTIITRPVDGGQILMVVKTPAPLVDADKTLRDRLVTLGFTVVLSDDDTVQASDAIGKAAVYVSSTSSDLKIGTKFLSIAQPVIVGLHLLYDEMQMTSDQGLTTAASMTLINPLHPLNSPARGVETVYTTPRPLQWGTPTPSADIQAFVTTPGGDKASQFFYSPGDLLVDGSPATGCRIAFPAEKTTVSKWVTTTIFPRFDRAVRWAVYGCGTGIIATVAGAGSGTVSPNGTISTGAFLNSPTGVLAEPDGAFIYADNADHRIRRVSPAGVVTTIAGTGTAGFNGNGLAATASNLNFPSRIRRDPQGLLVIVDTSNQRIRRIEANGTMVTIAGTGSTGSTGDGGQATAARLNAPSDVAWNAAGEMFIADRNNHKIRRVAVNGVITTVAGTGSGGYNGDDVAATSARLFSPYGVSFTADGTMLIADFDNNRIRAVDSVGVIRTVAGSGIATGGGDGGPATLADIHKPFCVTPRPAGGFFVCDLNNNKVRFVNGDGVISTVVGTGTAAFAGDGDLAIFARGNRFADVSIASNGDMYVVDRFNRRVRVVVGGGL